MQLELSNVINISVSTTPAGVNAFNTSNLAIFTPDTAGAGFGALGYKLYLSPTDVAVDFGTTSNTYKMALAAFSQQPNFLAAGGYLVVIPFVSSETLDTAITRTAGLVNYFGVLSARLEAEADMLAAAAVVQALTKVAFFPMRASATITPTTGSLDKLRIGGFTQSRGLYYGGATDLSALLFGAAYAGRALSTIFSGSNTTSTMHLKDLATIAPDPTMTQTLQAAATAAGADTYVSVQGVSKVLCSGANKFFDQIYNLLWYVAALQTAGFNYLAQASTKVPQTEGGMDGLKGAYRTVCEQAVANQYAAPGTWTSPTSFGVQADLFNNIAQRGYYIYSSPIAKQLQAERAARQAPLIQIALKEAGAVHSSTVIVNVNA